MGTYIIKKAFNFSVWLIERCNKMQPLFEKADSLKNLPEGTLGRDIANCLDDNKLNLVAGFESHDLKHVLLDYKMTPLDEIRMQAFMLGNGNYTFPCFAILIFGMVLLPNRWMLFYEDFQKGRKVMPISKWTIEEYGMKETAYLRETIVNHQQEKTMVTLQSITKIGAFTAIFAGIFGMLFCLPFLFSASVADLVGAGFPFVGGAILAMGGLIALSNVARTQNLKLQTKNI